MPSVTPRLQRRGCHPEAGGTVHTGFVAYSIIHCGWAAERQLHTEFELQDQDFRRISALVAEKTGIVISEQKRAFVQARLGRRLRALGLKDFSEYCHLLDNSDGDKEQHMLVNAVTTNHTAFFREPHHFDYLKNTVMPAILGSANQRKHRLRAWSAGCSTGEEPYTLAMILRDHHHVLDGWDARILATDLDTNVVDHAAAGRYDAERFASIPVAYQRRYVRSQRDGRFAMDDALRAMITFKPLNLLEPWPMAGPFDFIFCRNVMIYFNKATQRLLLDRFADILRPNGWLFVGHSESLLSLTTRFQVVGRTVYRKAR
ncbi:MAG TPA: protein-glutamate O-methyltransferase CheR [Rhodopila sp.]|nr:protein-glutamate O-methyltransferase CheR [Rhodopila sp.]